MGKKGIVSLVRLLQAHAQPMIPSQRTPCRGLSKNVAAYSMMTDGAADSSSRDTLRLALHESCMVGRESGLSLRHQALILVRIDSGASPIPH